MAQVVVRHRWGKKPETVVQSSLIASQARIFVHSKGAALQLRFVHSFCTRP